MAIRYEFDARPISPGESRGLTLTSATPARVQVRCFVTVPPPPGYKPCAECGSFSIHQNQTIQVKANQYLFSQRKGSLEIIITDLDGDIVQIQLKVTNDEPDNSSVAVAITM